MRKIKYLIAFAALLAAGCANEVVQDTIFLQNAKINAPVTQMPVFLSTSDTLNVIVIRPRMFIGKNNKYSSRLSGHSRVNMNGEFQVDTVMQNGTYFYAESAGANRYDFRGDNYELSTTSMNFGFDADIFLSNVFLLSGGLNFSNVDNTSLTGFRGGLGFKTYSIPMGVRFDVGLSWQQVHYDVRSVVVRSRSSTDFNEVIFLRDIGRQTNNGFYINLNLTHDHPDALLGGFLNVGYVQQNILDIEPFERDPEFYSNNLYIFDPTLTYTQTDMRNEIETGFFNLSSGLLFNYTSNTKLIAGIKYFTEISDQKMIENQIAPFIQLHLGF